MTHLTQGFHWLRRHAHGKVVVPVLVAAGLLAYVASLASAPQAAHALAVVLRQVWWIVLLLTPPYLAARLYVWHALLRELGLTAPFRRLLVSFAAGEMAKSLPADIYVENVLLNRLAHLDAERAVRSTVATTAILALESVLALAVVLVVGIPGAAWVRWGLLAVVGSRLVLLGPAWLLIRRGLHTRSELPRWLGRALGAAADFFADAAALLRWRTLTKLGPTALYMGVYAVDLFVILQALGDHLGWGAVITSYAAMVLAVVLIPIPTELGDAELSVLGALDAFGVPVGCEKSISGGLSLIIVDKPAQHIAPDDTPVLFWRGEPVRALLIQALMGPPLIIVGQIRPQHTLQMALAQDQQMVQALLPHAAHPAFGHRIRLRCPIRRLHALQPLCRQYRLKGGAKLRVNDHGSGSGTAGRGPGASSRGCAPAASPRSPSDGPYSRPDGPAACPVR